MLGEPNIIEAMRPSSPEVFRKGNVITTNLVSRGGMLWWNPETQRWERSWEEKVWENPDPKGQDFLYNPTTKEWDRYTGKPALIPFRGGRMATHKQNATADQITPEWESIVDYINGSYMNRR